MLRWLDRVPVLTVLLVLRAAGSVGAEPSEDWISWGGPAGNFKVPARGLATSWPEEGPPILWRKPLGDQGHSSVLHEDGILYTMARRGDNDAVVALRAESGESLWEVEYESPTRPNQNLQFGPGPHSSPLLVGDRLFTVSGTLEVHAFKKEDGTVAWRRDLMTELEAPVMDRGYGASPIAYENLIILYVGGDGQAVVALDQATGETVWTAESSNASYASPLLVTVDGQEQLIVTLGAQRAGLDPATGKRLWHVRLPSSAYTTMSTPIWDEERGLLFSSSAYQDGSRVLAISKQADGTFAAEERWYSRDMRIMHGSAVRLGNLIYGCSGDFGPTFLSAIDIETGEVPFRQRGFAKANLLAVGDHLLILDEDGTLGLGAPGDDGIEILAQASVLDSRSWTTPTLVGTRLFVRNEKEILAIELGKSG